MKEGLKAWRALDHPKEELELSKHKQIVAHLDHEAESRLLTPQEIDSRRDSFKSIAELEKFRVLDIKQISRVKWAVDGDENTRFFHGHVNHNNQKNGIDGLMINDTWCTDPVLIKSEAFNFFTDKFKEKWLSRPKLVSSQFKRILPIDNDVLEATITLEELKVAVWACGNEKAPGPDGFSFKFFKKRLGCCIWRHCCGGQTLREIRKT